MYIRTELVTGYGYKSLHLSASTTNRQGFRGAYPLQELSNPDAGAKSRFSSAKNLQQNVCPTSLRSFTSQSEEKLLFMRDGEPRRLHYLVRRIVSVADRGIDKNQIIHFSTRCLIWTPLCGLLYRPLLDRPTFRFQILLTHSALPF